MAKQYWWVNDRYFCYENLLHFGYKDGKKAEQQNLTSMKKGDLFIKYRASSNKDMWYEEHKRIPKQSIYAVGIMTSNEIINKREDGFEREVECQFLENPLILNNAMLNEIKTSQAYNNSSIIVTKAIKVHRFFVEELAKETFEIILKRIKLENLNINENKWNYSPKKEESEEVVNNKHILRTQNISMEDFKKNLKSNRMDEKFERDNTKHNNACDLHDEINRNLLEELENKGFKIIIKYPDFDLFAEKDGVHYLFEIKSLCDDESPRNQFKIGLGQLLMYDYDLKEEGFKNIYMFLVVPKTKHDLEYYRNLFFSKNIKIIEYSDDIENIWKEG